MKIWAHPNMIVYTFFELNSVISAVARSFTCERKYTK